MERSKTLQVIVCRTIRPRIIIPNRYIASVTTDSDTFNAKIGFYVARIFISEPNNHELSMHYSYFFILRFQLDMTISNKTDKASTAKTHFL